MKSNCNICSELANDISVFEESNYSLLMGDNKNLLYETANFSVIPSFGPLDKSHVMIVPKKHYNNFSQMNDFHRDEYERIIDLLISFYKEKHSQALFFFESGAGTLTDHSGGCVIHAHIHCLLEDERFELALNKELDLKPITSGTVLDSDFGYVWFKSKSGGGYYCNKPKLPSQYLRFLYYDSKTLYEGWNWKNNINIKKIYEVLDAYIELKSYALSY